MRGFRGGASRAVDVRGGSERRRREDRIRDRGGRPALILYLDTSALVRVYVREPGREVVARAVRESSRIATAKVSYTEARAAFAHLLREGGLTEEQHAGIIEALNQRWSSYEKLAVTERLVRLAGDLAQSHTLRGYDSIQLASASICEQRHEDVRFLAFDEPLKEAAGRIMSLYEAAE